VTRSITLDPRSGGPSPRIVETPSGLVNAIGLQPLDQFFVRYACGPRHIPEGAIDGGFRWPFGKFFDQQIKQLCGVIKRLQRPRMKILHQVR
jgi:hypothetical protein